MIFSFFKKKQSPARFKSLVLMYHRVAEPDTDVWEISVSPENFEQQLKALKEETDLVSLEKLLSLKNITKNTVALSFDDGYIDNFLVAKPLLEKYNIPATFFITSPQPNNTISFWWDELENYILLSPTLPTVFEMNVAGAEYKMELFNEAFLNNDLRQKHKLWKAAEEEPPTLRAKLYLKLWQRLQGLKYQDQQLWLKNIRQWAGISVSATTSARTINDDEIREIAENKLFTIGSHTATHPALSFHDASFQEEEIISNHQYLQNIIAGDVTFLAYPYGNYNAETLQLAYKLGFNAAFTTEEKTLQAGSPIHQIGRFQVKNLSGTEFKKQINKWVSS